MLRQVRQSNRLGLSDDEAKDAMTTRQRADPGRQLPVDSIGREVLEHSPVRREDSDGCITGTDDLCRHFHGALQDAFEGDLCDERRGGPDELPQALLCSWWVRHRSQGHAERYLRVPEQSLSPSSSLLHDRLARLCIEHWRSEMSERESLYPQATRDLAERRIRLAPETALAFRA